jgi:RimJ/RimL family protein N-acetyltransferase
MLVRVLNENDVDSYWTLRLESLEREPHAFGESATEHREKTSEEIRSRLGLNSAGGSFVVGAFEDGRLVGTAGFFRRQNEKEKHKGGIWGVYVTETARSKGLGRKLLTSVLAMARTQPGLERVNLTVAKNQTAARQLYSSLGFESIGCEREALKIGDVYVDEEHMVLRLADATP